MISYVKMFHRKFGLPMGSSDELLNDEEMIKLRIDLIEEELRELKDAIDSGDKVELFDALLDLSWVTAGTALCAGINVTKWRAGTEAVFNANMNKQRAESKDEAKRGTTYDVVKPDGWVGPEEKLKKILGEN